MSIPALRPPSPALPVAIGIFGAGNAIVPLVLTMLRVDTQGWQRGENQRLWTLVTMGGAALAIGATIVAAAAALSLARTRRSPGGALTAAAFSLGALALALQLVATWLWPWAGVARGWRHEAIVLCDWAGAAVPLLATAGLVAAGWSDRGVRLLAPGAIGAALLAAPPPALLSWAYSWVEFGAYKWDVDLGAYRLVPDSRLSIIPGLLALGRLAWAGATAALVFRQPPVPVDTVAPRPPARAFRRLAVAQLVMVAVAMAAGIALALVQGKPAGHTGPLSLVIPIAVAAASAGVAAALINIAVTDVVPMAARRAGVGAIFVLWCVAVIAAQTIGSQRPRESGALNPLIFTIFEPPWMPGMVGAIAAVIALLNITAALAAAARQAGRPPSRAQHVVVVLALAIGALSAPWVLGFGTRSLPLDTLRIATFGSAAIVNLAAWIALARSSWRTAVAFDEAVIASGP